MFRPNFRTVAFIASVAVALTACSTQASNSLPPVQGSSDVRGTQVTAFAKASQPCKGQETTARYALVNTFFEAKGGVACVPAIGGFGGTLAYPASNVRVAVTLVDSPTNYNNLPLLGHGKLLFYLRIVLRKSIDFSAVVGQDVGIAGSAFTPGKTYSAFLGATRDGNTFPIRSCDIVAVANNGGGALSGVGGLLRGVSAAKPLFVQIFPSKDAKPVRKC
jgi:hypothetical protein